jgi:hypothetical protein
VATAVILAGALNGGCTSKSSAPLDKASAAQIQAVRNDPTLSDQAKSQTIARIKSEAGQH